VEQTLTSLGNRSGLFRIETVDDAALLTAEKLKTAKVVIFYTTGEIPLNVDALTRWVKSGGAFVGIHPATDTLKGNDKYYGLIGAVFSDHPWNQNTTVTMKVHETGRSAHPAARPWGASATFREEIYRYTKVDWRNIRVLMSLDMEKTASPRRGEHVPISWVRAFGKGRVFYTSLGHRRDMWESRQYQEHLMGGIGWCLKVSRGESSPNPRLHQREEAIAKKVVAATRQASTGTE
jgi:type 1 glutamine amidotransferase